MQEKNALAVTAFQELSAQCFDALEIFIQAIYQPGVPPRHLFFQIVTEIAVAEHGSDLRLDTASTGT